MSRSTYKCLDNFPLPGETTHHLNTPEGEISYVVRRTSRRRTIELSVPDSFYARILAPRAVSISIIENFIHRRARWVRQRQAERARERDILNTRRYESGERFLFLGQAYPLMVDRSANLATKITFREEGWYVRAHAGANERIIRAKMIAWYRRQAGEVLGARVFHHCRLMAIDAPRVTVKTQKRLWGSCNAAGRSVNLNWMLVMAPMDVIDYVVVHELCHLSVPDHSRRFWDKVERHWPDYRAAEQWLKEHALNMRLP